MTFNFPVVLSTHPRTKKRLTDLGAELHPLIQEMKPFGFFDYVRLQQDSYCTISDSGTITEEAAIVGFPAVTARDTQERQEGMDSGVLVMTGIDSNSILDGINMARKHFDNQLYSTLKHPRQPQNYLNHLYYFALQIFQ